MHDGQVNVVLRPSMFKLEAIPHRADAGQSIADILLGFPGLPPEVWSHGLVRIGDHEIPREIWHKVKPKPGSRHMLQVCVRPGGGDGGKNAFAIIATIALVVATTAITGGILGPGGALSVSSTLFAAGSTSAALAAAGVSIVGALAINALVPPPTAEKQDDRTTAGTLGVSSIEGNTIGQFEPIPFVAGTHKVTPPHLVPPWSESINDDQYINAIVGLNGPHLISDIRINDAPIASLSGVEYEIRDVITDDSDLTVITKQVYEVNVGLELPPHKLKDAATSANSHELQDASTPANSHPTWQTARTRSDCDELWLTFFWSGLLQQETSGGTTPGGVGIRIRMRQIGDASWINLPELHAQREKLESFRGTVKLKWRAVDSSLPAIDQNQSFPPWKYAFYAQNADNQEGFDTHSYFAPGAGKLAAKILSDDGVAVIFLDPATFPKGTYEIQVTRGYGYKASDLSTSYVYLGVSAPFFFTHTPSSSPPAIGKDQSKVPVKLSWQTLSGVWNEYPLREKGMTLLAVRAKNLAISSLTMLAQGYAHVWDGTDWDTYEPSNNPAAWWRELALGGQSIRAPFAESQLNDDELAEWYDFCGDRRTIGRAFDGSADYYTRGAGLTGAADSKLMTFSVWVRRRSHLIEIFSSSSSLAGTADRLKIEFSGSDGQVVIVATNSAGTTILGVLSQAQLPIGQWSHVLASFDLSDTNKRHLYVNDVSGLIVADYADDTIDFTVADYAVGAYPSGAAFFEGDIAELWFAPGVYIDFSDEANRRKFISANGRPVGLGATGNLPTGSAPLVYLSGNGGHAFETNLGTGGGFTVHGSPDAATVFNGATLSSRECNAYFAGNKTLGEALKIVAACGHAASRISDKTGVIIERDRSAESPVALFSQRNSRDLAIRRAFPRVPDGFRVRFNDEGNDYRPTEIFVYRNLSGTEIEAVDYIGITNPDRAIERANLDFKQLLRRPALYNIETDIQNLYCTKGSLVSLTHDTLKRHYDSARIVAATLSGGTLTGLVTDSTLRLDLVEAGEQPCGVIIQLKDGSTLTLDLAETEETDTVTFAGPPPLPSMFTDQGAWATSTAYAVDDVVTSGGAAYAALGAHTSGAATEPDVGTDWIGVWEPLLKDCLVAAGPFSSVEKRMLVLGIKPQNQFTASMTLIDEAAPVLLLSSEADGGQQILTASGEPIYLPF
jgi:hypothetical protein